MSSIFGFSGGPTYRAATTDSLWTAALDQPMSAGATFWDQAKGGVLESFGLGSAIRDAKTPDGAPLAAGRYERPDEFKARRDTFAVENKVLDEEAYKTSPYFRDEVPWDASMTEDRAAALATMYDAKRVRQYFAEKRPIWSFFGNMAGQAVDPINWVPVAGPTVRAAAVARMGLVKGIAATAALDAAANTAIAGLATRETRRGYGDDVSWQAMVSEIATAALLGTAFGTVGGVLQRRAGLRADALRSEAEVKVQTLKATQEARIALNEAIGGLANDGEVRLSPNATAPIERVSPIAERVISHERATAADDFAEWFQGSKIVDPDGIPVAVYHGTGSKTPISTFRSDLVGSARPQDGSFYGEGFYFTQSRELADEYIPEGSGGHVEEAHIVARKPFEWDRSTWELQQDTYARAKEIFPEFKDSAVGVSPDQRGAWKEALQKNGYDAVIVRAKAIDDGMNEIVVFSPDQIRTIQRASRTPVDASPARPDPIPQGRAEAEAKVAKPENYKALADQYRVDPETGAIPEDAEIRQLKQEGRLSDEDMAVLDDADAEYQDGAAYGEALRSVVGCLL